MSHEEEHPYWIDPPGNSLHTVTLLPLLVHGSTDCLLAYKLPMDYLAPPYQEHGLQSYERLHTETVELS